MAKEKGLAAKLTLELPGFAKPRGRPVSGTAKTPAQRKAAERQRRAEEWPQWLDAIYRAGYADAAAGKAPQPKTTWRSAKTAQAYLADHFSKP